MPVTTEITRLASAAGVVAAYATLCLSIWLDRRNHGSASGGRLAPQVTHGNAARPVVVAFASQTGFGEELALDAAEALRTAGLPVNVLPLGQLKPSDLTGASQALFVISTCGEGDAPDNGAQFVGRLMADTHALDGLHYGLLALGDRTYSNFCGFGRDLDAWLCRCGAHPRFERVEVNSGDPMAIARWRHELRQFIGDDNGLEWTARSDTRWRLAERRLLNPGSRGGETWHIALMPEPGAPLPIWEAGDLVQITPPADPDRPRSYSIASTPADGAVHLLVRRHILPNGAAGTASGWLTGETRTGDPVFLRIRPHTNFRLGANADRPLILIGNGTGIAGLRALLRQRAADGQGRNWLIFGEREAARDFYYRDEIDGWLREGALERLDLAFSRDGPEKQYVQHHLAACADVVRAWVAAGAALYVCGDAVGMAPAVDAVLSEIVGTDMRDTLIASGRYRRDVY